jgi:hypothetical protein
VTTLLNQHDADLPRLEIVPTDSLVAHEEFDPQRSEPLVGRLRSERLLKNPPIVASIQGEDRYVVLDGTNRVVAMSLLACPHIVVQVVDYDDPNLILDTWHHVVTHMPVTEFFDALNGIDGLRVEPGNQLHARAELARRQATAYALLPETGVYLLYAEGDIQRRTATLARLVNLYQQRGRIHRVSTDHFEQLQPLYADIAALVVFPRYEPSEIVELARQGGRVPAGVTRHVIPGRALRLNFPIDVLADGRSLDEKNAWLQTWLRAKLVNQEMRYYQESTYLFDE